MVARGLMLIVCATVLFACASDNIRDLSNRAPFNRYVGRTVHLLRPAYLIEEDFWTGPQYGISDGRMRGALDHPLPVGHPIHLDSVKVNPAFSPYALALGHTFVPALGKEVPFHFYWAAPDGLGRAPWEPKSVPEFQFINDPAFLR
jgi:hypothetical protein